MGAGFAGLEAARALRHAPVEVLMIDRTNYHTFQPLLYQVAAAGLEPGEIAHAVRGIFQKHPRFRFRMGEVTEVDPSAGHVALAEGTAVAYDALLLAAGASPAYFGVEGAEGHAFPLKGLSDATRLRSHILHQFEQEARPEVPSDGSRTKFVIVGGGPTGVEMVGATDEEGRPYPQLAPVAQQQGRHAARQIQRRLAGVSTEPFEYDDPGMMATIGRNAAVVQGPGGFEQTGWIAWLLWTVLHIWELIGFRNRLAVMLDWIYSYFTYDRSARLIFDERPTSRHTSHNRQQSHGQTV